MMNKLLGVICAAVLVGCATTGGLTPAQRADRARAVLHATAESAVLYAYSRDTNTTRYVDLTISVLDKFLSQTNYTPVALRSALTNVPVRELRSVEAQLALTTIEMTYDLFWSDLIRQNVDAAPLAKGVLTGLRDGVVSGRTKIR